MGLMTRTVVRVRLKTVSVTAKAALGVFPFGDELRVEVVGSLKSVVLPKTHFGTISREGRNSRSEDDG